jgi:predicted transcriptional regulator
MKKLTKAEEELMQHFWDYGPLKTSELVQKYPEPRPALTTVSTIVRILEEKGMVNHKKEGRGYRYFPLLSREEYRQSSLKELVQKYFGGSSMALVSHLVEKEEVPAEELEELLAQIKKLEQ